MFVGAGDDVHRRPACLSVIAARSREADRGVLKSQSRLRWCIKPFESDSIDYCSYFSTIDAGRTFAASGSSPNSRRARRWRSNYSIMYFDAGTERPDITNVGTASADDMRALWNGWVANTVTYEVKGDFVTIHPTGAKNPAVMKPGANEVYRLKVEGNMLSWTQQRNARGVDVTGAATATFIREE
jgi:hypothetical protein